MCGLLGVVNESREVAADLFFGLLAEQHRGQECAGAQTSVNGKLYRVAGMGEIPQALSGAPGATATVLAFLERLTHALPKRAWHELDEVLMPQPLKCLPGTSGIAHNRYSTSAGSTSVNIQPIERIWKKRKFALAFGGNLINEQSLRRETKTRQHCSDAHVIADLLARSRKSTMKDAIEGILPKLKGSFNLLVLFGGTVYAVRDSFGFHPLQYGRRGGDHIVASESCALRQLHAEDIRDIENGEMLILRQGKEPISYIWAKDRELKVDLFEFIYFLRPDSVIHGVHVGTARRIMGDYTAIEQPVDADVIFPVPDSGNMAAQGFAWRMADLGSKAVYEPYAILRPHTVGRTFIEPMKEVRDQYLYLKFYPQPTIIGTRRVCDVDDSNVRGATAKRVGGMIREAGAREVHMRFSSPPYMYPDFYGIDTYRVRGELIARMYDGDTEKIADVVGADSVGYLSLSATIRAVCTAASEGSSLTKHSFYTGPFTGEYPAGMGDFSIT